MKLVDTKTLSEIVEIAKTLFEIAALTLAGFWAVYGFFVFRQRDQAAAELRRTELDAQRIVQELRKVAIIRPEISAEITEGASGVFLLFAEVFIRNDGSRDTRLSWRGGSAAFSITRVEYGGDGIPVFLDDPIRLHVRLTLNPEQHAVSHVIRAGASERLTFTARLPGAGVYLLSFRADLDQRELIVSQGAGTRRGNSVSWTATKFIYAGRPPSEC